MKLSSLPGVLIQEVAAALDIHPFMLSRWRKQAREGVIVTRGVKVNVETAAELKRLRRLALAFHKVTLFRARRNISSFLKRPGGILPARDYH